MTVEDGLATVLVVKRLEVESETMTVEDGFIVDDTNNGGVGRINGDARVDLRGGVPGCCGGGVPYMWVVYVVVKKGADVDPAERRLAVVERPTVAVVVVVGIDREVAMDEDATGGASVPGILIVVGVSVPKTLEVETGKNVVPVEGIVVVSSTLIEGTTVVVGAVEIIGTVVVARLGVSVPKTLEVETGKNVVPVEVAVICFIVLMIVLKDGVVVIVPRGNGGIRGAARIGIIGIGTVVSDGGVPI